jgi:1-hydroxy-2-naphthoate dioxygenase
MSMASQPPATSYSDEDLAKFHETLGRAHMRGQWQNEKVRKSGGGGVWDDGSFAPKAGGDGHLWPWHQVRGFLAESCDAVPESFTSRRSIMFNNPGLARGTTNTINMGIQMIRPGELAWAHRHSISAIRFVIDGDAGVSTVVDGINCPMETGDLILTPQWMWHDHHNKTNKSAVWLDVLDGPVLGMFNQIVFESYGEKQQPVRNVAPEGSERVLRYPWREAEAALLAKSLQGLSRPDGIIHDYLDPYTGESPLPTLGCRLHRLPAGFTGERHRRAISAVYHVVRGEGRTTVGDRTLEWRQGDSFVVPNWSWRSHENLSTTTDAILFSVHDTPLLKNLGLYREDLVLRVGAESSDK